MDHNIDRDRSIVGDKFGPRKAHLQKRQNSAEPPKLHHRSVQAGPDQPRLLRAQVTSQMSWRKELVDVGTETEVV